MRGEEIKTWPGVEWGGINSHERWVTKSDLLGRGSYESVYICGETLSTIP